MKCKICGKNYKCNKCAYDKHVDSHKMEPFKIRKFNDFGDHLNRTGRRPETSKWYIN